MAHKQSLTRAGQVEAALAPQYHRSSDDRGQPLKSGNWNMRCGVVLDYRSDQWGSDDGAKKFSLCVVCWPAGLER
jgi:hypothetical protein